MKKTKLSVEKLISLGTVAVILFLWYFATQNGWVNKKLIPTPIEVIEAFFEVWKDYKNYSLLQHLGTSMKRLLMAFGLKRCVSWLLLLQRNRSLSLQKC